MYTIHRALQLYIFLQVFLTYRKEPMIIDNASLPVSSELQLCFYTLCESIIPDLIEVKGKLKKENNGHLDIFSRTKMMKY